MLKMEVYGLQQKKESQINFNFIRLPNKTKSKKGRKIRKASHKISIREKMKDWINKLKAPSR